MRARVQDALKIAVKVYLMLILLILPLYMQDGFVMIGNAKYLFFRNVTLFVVLLTTVMLVALAVIRNRERKRSLRISSTDLLTALYGGSAILSWCFSSDKYTAWWGAPGWYMGLMSQLMFVWIYFAVSRWCDDFQEILRVCYVGTVIVMEIGILNRYVFDPLSVFEGLEDWNREHLLSTIGNQNWYCGYVSAASAVCVCFACAGEKKLCRAAGLAGSLLFFWTIMTQGSEGGYLIVAAEISVVFFWSLDNRKKFLTLLCVLTCWPAAALLGKYCIRFRGLMLVEDGTLGGILLWRGWKYVLAVLAVLLMLFCVREKRGCRDRLESGKVKKAALWAAAGLLAVFAVVFLLCQVWESFWIFLGEKTLLRVTDSWGSGRGALWRMSLGCFAQGTFSEQWFGVGPDCFGNAVYALYPVNDIIHPTGQWEKALYANAHNEWLNMLVNQGILGLVCYVGIFITLFVRVCKYVHRNSYMLLGLLAVSGYCAYGLVSFQQTVSTPLIFVILGISEAMLRKEDW